MAARQQSHQRSNVERDLGALENGLATLIDEFREERRGAHEYRKDMRTVVSAMGESLRVLAHEVAEHRRVTSEKIAAIEPTVIEFRSVRDQNKGAAKIVRGIYALLGLVATGAAAFVGWKVHP